MQKPFDKTPLSAEEQIFNKRLSMARSTVERAFGILVNRFQVFLKPINLHPTKAIIVINAALVLHNYLRTGNMTASYPDEPVEMENIGRSIDFAPFRGRDRDSGKAMRMVLVDYFTNEGMFHSDGSAF